MEWVPVWLFLSAIVGAVGANRVIGFWGAFIISLILSPIIDLIFTVTSKRLSDLYHEQALRDTQKKQEEILRHMHVPPIPKNNSIALELERLKKLKDEGIISDEELNKLKDNLINKI